MSEAAGPVIHTFEITANMFSEKLICTYHREAGSGDHNYKLRPNENEGFGAGGRNSYSVTAKRVWTLVKHKIFRLFPNL